MHIFNTEATKGLRISKELLGSCTGYNSKILKAVWEKQGTAKLVHNVIRRYNTFRRKAKPGEVYTAVIYCRTGYHRSVAISILLKQIIDQGLAVPVKIVHRSYKLHKWCSFRF